MDFEWTPTYTAIAAAIISSSLLTLFTEPVLNKIKLKRTFRGWQAVFLTNDQVYFGKITDLSRNDITLEKVFYLKSTELMAGRKASAAEVESSFSREYMEVVKLGGELHAPLDAMVINRSQINFMENISDRGHVVNEIHEFYGLKPKQNGA